MAKNALVLGGGGARGAYQIGAWQALSEMDFKPNIVTGTSVGALNGALYVQNSLPDAINLWENLETHMILEPEVSKNLKKGSVFSNLNAFTQEIIKNGGVDSTPLLKLLKTHIDEEKIRASKVDLGIMTVTFPNLKPVLLFKDEIPKGKLCDYLMASAALFPAMRSYEIDGNAFIDGGYKDNMPVQMAIDRGADKIIAICLDPPNLYRIPKIDADVTYIKSRTSLGNLLFFDKDTTKRNMRLGYLDTLKAIGKLQGFLYSFDNDEVFIKNILPIFKQLINISNNDRLSRFIIFRHMRSAIGQKLTPELCILHCADEAANIYGLDNLKTYKLFDLSNEIYEKYKKSGPGAFESIDLFAKITNNSKTLVHHTVSRFLNFSRHDIVAFFVSEISSTLKNQIPGRGFFTAAAICPSEFQAAIYITALINQDAV